MSELKDLLPFIPTGPYLLIAIIALILIGFRSRWIFANKEEQKKARKVIKFSAVVALVAGLAMFVNHLLEKSTHSFPIGQTGVLVLRIAGDDDNSLQSDLVESLRRELKRVSLTNSIIVLASDEQLDDTKVDTSVAHQSARSIGKQFNAQVVIWGDRVEKRKFWPRVTVVNHTAASVLLVERDLEVQFIDDQSTLPLELVDEPVYLAYFISGHSALDSGHLDQALSYLESASKLIKRDSLEMAQLRFYIALCHLAMAETVSDPEHLLIIATDEFRSAANVFGKTNSPENWAKTQVNLAAALLNQTEHSEGAVTTNLLAESDTACRAALEIYTPREKFPQQWAAAQDNLAATLSKQAKHSKGVEAARLLAESVKACRAAQEVSTRGHFPKEWALAQLNLGAALCDQAEQNEGANAARLLAESVEAFRGAQEVFTRSQFPQSWAKTQNNLGSAMADQAKQSHGPEATRLFAASIAAYQAAQEVFTQKQFPRWWVLIQVNLCITLATQAQHSQSTELPHLFAESITAYRAALEIYTREQFPQQWAWTQSKLGGTLDELARKSKGIEAARFLGEAITANNAALEIYTREQFPQQWATVQTGLGATLGNQARQSQGVEPARLLAESVAAYRAALVIYTRGQFPQDWAMAQCGLGTSLGQLAGQSKGAEAARLLSDSITAYRAALTIWKPDEFPDFNRMVLDNLAMSEQALHQFQK